MHSAPQGMSAGTRRGVPGLTRVRMLMCGLTDDVYDRVTGLNVWSQEGCSILKQSSVDSDRVKSVVRDTYRQLWQVAHEVFGKTADALLSSRDAARLAMSFVQCCLLVRFIDGPGTEDAETLQVAHTCLSLLAGLGAAGEAALDKLADGLYIISRHVADCVAERNGSSGAYALACSYTSALTALAAAATNRRKLFSVGTQRLMPVCLSIAAEGDASAQWIAHADLLLAASLLDEKHVDELSKGSLPEAEAGMVPVIASTQDTAGAKRRRVDNGEGRGGTHAYSEELFSSVSRLVSSDMTSGTAIAVGLARLLQLFVSQVTAAGLTAPSHDSAVIRHRRASAQVLHFALSLLHACAARAPPGSDDARVPVRVHCRAALLSCLSDHFASTAIPDHSSLERYSALIRSLYTALLADLEEAQSSSDAVKDDLLGSVRSLVRVDHRPVVAAAEGEPTNALLNSLIENLDRSGCIAGGRSLLATLIKLHHDLRLMPALIQALFTGAAKAGDGGRLSCLMLEPGLQASLKQVTEGMSGVQLALCWIATKESFFAADRSPLLLLQAWSQPLAWAYVSSGNSLLSDVPLKSALLPLLKDMQSKLEKVQISHPSKGKSKSGKRKVLDVDSVPDGNRDAALRIAEILAELCAVHSAQAPTLARLPDPSDESDLEQWAAVYRSAGDMLRLLAVDTLSVGQASCALQLFTLLVTIDAVRDVSLELSSDGSSIDPDASLSAMLCGLASAKEMSADMSLMLLGRLAVWSHLLRCSTHGPNHENFVEECIRVAIYYLNGPSSSDCTGSALIEVMSSSSFLELEPMVTSLARCVAALDKIPTPELCALLRRMPVEVRATCLTGNLQNTILSGAMANTSASAQSALVLIDHYSDIGATVNGVSAQLLLRTVLSHPSSSSREVVDLCLLLLRRLLESASEYASAGMAIATLRLVMAVEWRSLWGTRHRPVKGSKSAATEVSAVFIQVIRAACEGLVSGLSRVGVEEMPVTDISEVLEQFIPAYLEGLPKVSVPIDISAFDNLLDRSDIIFSCARVAALLNCVTIRSGADPVYVGLLSTETSAIFGALVRSKALCDNQRIRFMRVLATCALLVSASGGSAPAAADVVAAMVDSVSRHSEPDLETMRGFSVAGRAALLSVRDSHEVLMICQSASKTLFDKGNRAGVMGAAVVEAVVLSVLDMPDRFALVPAAEVSIVTAINAACGVLQETSIHFVEPVELLSGSSGGPICHAVADTWQALLGALQQYQQRRMRAKHASIRAAKTRRRPGSEAAMESISKHGGDVLAAKLQDVMDLWSAGCVRVCADWICKIGLNSEDSSEEGRCRLYTFIEKTLRLTELAITIQSDAHLNTTGHVLGVVLRAAVAVLCSHTMCLQRHCTDMEAQTLGGAVRQCSRLLAGVSSCRALEKYIHLFAAVVVEVMSKYPSVCNTAAALGGVGAIGASVDIAPLISGLFCMFDRCRTSKQRLQMFAALGSGSGQGASEARMLMAEMHETYLREYKFVGMA